MNTEWFKGRAEHVASGELVHFDSRDELIAFLERVLNQACAGENRQAPIRLDNSRPTPQLSNANKRQRDE
jgi:hypothetical protein